MLPSRLCSTVTHTPCWSLSSKYFSPRPKECLPPSLKLPKAPLPSHGAGSSSSLLFFVTPGQWGYLFRQHRVPDWPQRQPGCGWRRWRPPPCDQNGCSLYSPALWYVGCHILGMGFSPGVMLDRTLGSGLDKEACKLVTGHLVATPVRKLTSNNQEAQRLDWVWFRRWD